jgi:hypothetical protein
VISQRLQRFEHASPIGRWSVTVCRPDPRLADFVLNSWYGEGYVAYQRDRILPSGQSQLLINLGPPQYRIEPGPPERRVPFVDVWYSALHQGPIDTKHRTAARCSVSPFRRAAPIRGSVQSSRDSPTASSRSPTRWATACSRCASVCSTRQASPSASP